MSRRNFSDLENQITSIVNKALKAVDSVNLKGDLRDKRDYTVNKIKTKVDEYSDRYSVAKNKRDIKNYINKKPNGQVKGYVYIIIGILGVTIFSFLLVIFSMFSMVISNVFTLGTYIGIGMLLAFLGGSALFLARGVTLRSRLTRFKKYIKLMNNKSYILISDLANLSGLKEKFLIKDLKKMSNSGMFLEAHIDEEKTHFMLSDDVYRDYINLKKQQMNDKVEEEEEKVNVEDEEEKSTIEIGRDYIEQINSIRAKLYKTDLTNKLERLVNIANQIINYVEKNPKKIKDINKFVIHYLPITIKLINSYSELDKQEIQSDNIKNAKNEIENSIDTINIAFERLLDELFEETAMDISSDISVLETLFKQEGLGEKDFKK
ncbi:5-bromo-4-chloroindolyl phosphate hydrolysis family protein [uncultured Clostridium sp.]|uniref:5-bromo-4-chloroindolyl phosphate hydrolysis family protein n=1 Tax=uncultured Clostridium sp. TaxID=59620 RepID=UPI0026349F54|nr:5-bromo-4-chloroindolyl phosphate hydrolysis family protein [uncultured Clostridium sp.]